MASVWWARHELLNRDVAIKIERSTGDADLTSRFLREAQIIAKFQHRNIVSVLDAGTLEEEGCHFLVMELLRGRAFSELLEPCDPIPPEEVLPILADVCRGLEEAHAAGVIHRDIKPENIFLATEPGGEVVPKILDFGVSSSRDAHAEARITSNGQILGTPAYMSPEQASGLADVTPASDLWSIGVILYEALAAKQPFSGNGHLAILRSITDDEPEPLPAWVDDRIRAIVARCLQKDPAHRYQDAASLRADLEAALAALRARKSAPTEPSGPSLMPFCVPEAAKLLASDPPEPRPLRVPRRALPRARSPLYVVPIAIAICILAVAAVPGRPAAAPASLEASLGRAARWQAARVIAYSIARAAPAQTLAEPAGGSAAPRPSKGDADAASPPKKPTPRRKITNVTNPGF